MNKQKLLLITIIAISIFIQSCTKEASSDIIISNYDFEYILMANDSNSKMLSIYNSADSIIDITFQLNNHFWFSKQQMISDINNLKPDTIQNMETQINRVVSFINQFSRHSNPLNIDDRILYNPFIMFNSIGSGFCNHRSAVSNLIWNEMGLKTRLIHLDGHAVSEVFTKSKWQVIDVDNGIYFSDTANTILSLNEIIKNNDKINIKYIKESTSISLIYMLLNREYFLNLFTSFENNNLDKSGFENISWDSTFLTLPPKSKFEFPVYNKRHKTDFQHSFCRLKIPKGFVGFINIPFVIDHIEGNGVLIKGLNHIVTSESKSMNNPGVYRVISDSLEIYSYINPLLIKFDSCNKFQISSNCHNKPIVKLTNSGLQESNLWGNEQNNQFFKNINQYLLYFNEQSNLQTTLNIKNFEELENSIFKLYFDVFKTKINKKILEQKINFIRDILIKHNISIEIFFKSINNSKASSVIIIGIIELDKTGIEIMIRDFLCS